MIVDVSAALLLLTCIVAPTFYVMRPRKGEAKK